MASPQTAVPIMAVGPVLKLPGMTATLPTRLAARAKTGTRGRRPLTKPRARAPLRPRGGPVPVVPTDTVQTVQPPRLWLACGLWRAHGMPGYNLSQHDVCSFECTHTPILRHRCGEG